MSANAAKLLIAILLVLGLVALFLSMLEPPTPPKPPTPPAKVVPPTVSPRTTFDPAPSTNQPAGAANVSGASGTNRTGANQPDNGSGQAKPEPVLPLWDWKAIATKAGVSGMLYAVEFDAASQLGRSLKPGCRMTVGDGASFQVIHYKPDHDEYPHESLGMPPKGKPLPDAIVDPYALMDMVRKDYPNAEFITLRAMHRGRPVYKLDFDRTGKGEDFADLTFCAETGIDITAEMAGK